MQGKDLFMLILNSLILGFATNILRYHGKINLFFFLTCKINIMIENTFPTSTMFDSQCRKYIFNEKKNKKQHAKKK